jgi:hypothetical protein
VSSKNGNKREEEENFLDRLKISASLFSLTYENSEADR